MKPPTLGATPTIRSASSPRSKNPTRRWSSPVTTTYAYYGFGPLYRSDQSNQQRTWVYNWLGQTTSQTLPESGTTTFSYDDTGRLTAQTDARSKTSSFTYDDANRLTQRGYSDSTPTVSFGYDSSSQTGLRTSMTDALGSVTYSYDNVDRLTQESRSLTGISGTFSTSYVYNVKGDLVRMTYPSGRTVNFDYKTGGGCCNSRLDGVTQTVSGTTSSLASTMSWNGAGGLLSRTLNPGSNAVVESFEYNNRLQQTRIRATKGSTDLMDFTYDYGTASTNTGRVLSRTDAIQGEHGANYVYDSIYRLSQVVSADSTWGIAWTFDTWGNRTAQTPLGLAGNKVGTQTRGYTNNRDTGFTYDAAGNETNDGNHSYTFDAANQITQMDGGAATYGYDGEGRRMKKVANSETTYYFYGPGGIISEFSLTGSASAASTSDNCAYRTSDRLGTAALVFAASGSLVIENNRTLPYGELWNPDVSPLNKSKFTTYERDSESSIDYSINRYYKGSYGRFVSADPFARIPKDMFDALRNATLAAQTEVTEPPTESDGKQIDLRISFPRSWNAYAYVSDDPINLTDRLGLEPEGPGLGNEAARMRCYQAAVAKAQAAIAAVRYEMKRQQAILAAIGGAVGILIGAPTIVGSIAGGLAGAAGMVVMTQPALVLLANLLEKQIWDQARKDMDECDRKYPIKKAKDKNYTPD